MTATGLVAQPLTLLNEDGATCDIPDTYNAAPFDNLYNIKGMGDFCVFPLVPFQDALEKRLKECPMLPYPICGDDDDLVVGPGMPVRPCYKLVE